MNELALVNTAIPAMSNEAVAKVAKLEEWALTKDQIHIPIEHTIHGGMYARTLMLPAGIMITGALIKVPTVLIIAGDAIMYTQDGPVEIAEYAVLPASAHRKQAFYAIEDTYMTMLFPTKAKTVEDAEREFTDEIDALTSTKDEASNIINITGE